MNSGVEDPDPVPGMSVRKLQSRFGLPDEFAAEDGAPVWRFQCADRSVKLYLDRAEHDEGRVVIVDADFE